MSNFLPREQERDFLLSSIITIFTLAKAGSLTNENVLAITTQVLGRIEPAQPVAAVSSGKDPL